MPTAPLSFAITNTLRVGQADDGPIDYTSLKDAVDFAIAQGASATDPWRIEVYPGTYVESAFTMQAGVIVTAATTSSTSVIVQAAVATVDLITMNGGVLQGMTIEGVTDASAACVRCASTAALSVLSGVNFRNCSYGLYVSGGAQVAMVACSSSITAASQRVSHAAVYATGSGSFVAANGFFASVPAALLPAYADNPIQRVLWSDNSARIQVSSIAFAVAPKNSAQENVLADNGAEVGIFAGDFSAGYTAIRIGAGGSTTKITAQSINISGHTTNFQIDSSTGRITTFAWVDAIKRSLVAGASLDGVISDSAGTQLDLVGDVRFEYVNGDGIELAPLFHLLSSTGLHEGGAVTKTGGLGVDVAAGSGLIEDDGAESVRSVTWSLTSLTLTDNATNYVYYDDSTDLIVDATSPPGVQSILLATVVTASGAIRFCHTTRKQIENTQGLLHSYLLATRKFILNTGIGVAQGTTNTKLNVGSGSYYRALDLLSVAGSGGDATFSYFYNGGLTEVPSQTDVDLTQYDNAGTLTAMTAGYFRADTVIITSDNRISVVYGTAEFVDQASAEAATTAAIPSFMEDTGITLALVVVEQAVGIVSIIDKRPMGVSGGGGGGGVSDHGLLSGLGDDDHTQYLLGDGSRAMSGNLDMGANAITNVGNVDGVDVSAHAARHNPGGIDAIATAIAGAAAVGDTAAEGSAASVSRSDHRHSVAAGTPVATGAANAAGSASTFVRSDHVHRSDTPVQDEGALVGTRRILNFIGAGVTAADDAGGDRVNITIPGGTAGDQAAVQARRTTTFAIPLNTFGDISLDVTDLENDAAILNHDLVTNTDRILVGETGPYLVGYHADSEATPAGETQDLEMRIRVNDTTVLDGTLGRTTINNVSVNITDELGGAAVVNLTAGDFISLQARRVSKTGSGSFNLRVGTTFYAIRLKGTKGDTGTPGAGSTVIVKDENINVPNTPHSELDFQGAGVAVTDGGSGRAIVTIPGAAGLTTFVASATNAITEASLTFQLVPGLTITPGAGTYLVWCSMTASHNKNGGNAVGSLFADGVAVLRSERSIGGQANNQGNLACQAEITVGAGAAIEMRWRSTLSAGGGEVSSPGPRTLTLLKVS